MTRMVMCARTPFFLTTKKLCEGGGKSRGSKGGQNHRTSPRRSRSTAPLGAIQPPTSVRQVRNCAEFFEIVLCKIILYQDLGENSQDLGIYIACLRNEIRNCVMKSVITPITFNYVSITRN